MVRKIVCRPDVNERRELAQARLELASGLVGDNWLRKGYRKTADGSAHPDMQLTLMNAHAIALIAGSEDRWALAGDQFFIDLDLSHENLPPGTQLQVGEASIEVTAEPHLGCSKFAESAWHQCQGCDSRQRAFRRENQQARAVPPAGIDDAFPPDAGTTRASANSGGPRCSHQSTHATATHDFPAPPGKNRCNP